MALKISQEFPTASLDITEYFHILHSAYYTFVIPSSKQKHTPGSLTHTHTHTHTHTTSDNYKPNATGHVTSLANGHFTGSDAPFLCEIVTASSNIKIYNFADSVLAVGTPGRRLCSNEGIFQAFVLIWQTAQNRRLYKTGGTYYQSCMYPTNSA